jgi:PAS domain S-box-containing protein
VNLVSETERLAALADYQLLDTPGEELFDALARLAAQICGTPISLISLIDSDRQWFKSNIGLEHMSETAREIAFCDHAIRTENLFEITDTRDDERFAENPLVTGDPNVRFYAGVPLVTSKGAALGTLCVLDRKPRELTIEQKTALRAIADAILEQFESRRALLRLFDSSQIEIFHVDQASQRVVFASEAARRNLGYSANEMRSLPLATLLPQLQDPARFAQRVRDLHKSPDGRMTVTSIAARKNGTTYPIELRIELVRTQRSEIALVFGTDLSDRAATQERITLLRTAIEEASEAIAIVQPQADGREIFVYTNSAFLRQKGTRLEDVIGKSVAVFDGPLTDRAMLGAFNAQLLAGRAGQCEYVAYRADGTAYNASITARPIVGPDGAATHFVIVQRDVSEQVRRERFMTAQNDRLTALTQTARELFSSLDGRVLIASLARGVQTLVGASARVYIPLPDGGFTPTLDLTLDPKETARGDAAIDAAVLAAHSTFDEVTHRRIVPIRSPAGKTTYVLDIEGATLANADVFSLELFAQYFAVAARNVELYSELAGRRASVVELNQIKNDLIAMLAHDFKGPLTTIVGFADVLAEEAPPESDTLQYLNLISSSAMRLASLATDTLALSRLEQNELVLEIDDVDLRSLVGDVARSFAHQRPVELTTDSETFVVAGDAARLRQVFENLIGNAIKYSPDGEPIEITMRAQGEGVETAIRDYGIGIPDADRARLFGRFARASNARRLGITGTGFGLFLCRTIVDLHGGTIEVESVEGAGSTFRVILPSSTSQHRPRTRRVLVQDRDGESRSYIGHSLRGVGYAVTILDKAADVALAAAQTPSDVAIIDVDRLEGDPDDFLATIDPGVRERTGFVWLGQVPRNVAGEVAWDAFVSKPFLMKDLQLAVETAASRALVRSASR